MRILHISTSDMGHGAGIAAYRLFCAQRKSGLDVSMLVAEKLSDDTGVTVVRQEPALFPLKALYRAELFVERVLNVAGPQNLYSVLSRALLRHDLLRRADLVHLHNLHWHSRNFSLLLPLLLGRRFPLVWTFHDMWPITGHCISSRECERWRNSCGKCPYPQAYLGQLYDTSRLQCHLKRYVYRKANFTVVTPSHWLADRVRQGSVVEKQKVLAIPNSVNSCFRPVEKKLARKMLGLTNIELPVILFLSAFLDDPIKGYPHFEEALCRLYDTGRLPAVQLLLVGRGNAGERLKKKFPVVEFGYVEEQNQMALIYAAADIYVMPSILDNLPSVVLESMACGTAVVCFDAGGIPEMVRHGVTGYVARKGDVDDLACGIELIVCNLSLAREMGCAGVARVADCFSESAQVASYLDLYHELTRK